MDPPRVERAARAAIGADAFSAAYTRGQAMSSADVGAYLGVDLATICDGEARSRGSHDRAVSSAVFSDAPAQGADGQRGEDDREGDRPDQ
jgi:hypothetical protein